MSEAALMDNGFVNFIIEHTTWQGMNMYFGLATKNHKLFLDTVPGHSTESWAIERSSGKWGHEGEWDYYASLSFARVGDTVGIYLKKDTIFFYSNGKCLGPAF